MKLVHYVDLSKVKVYEGKEYPLNYYMLEYGNEYDSKIIKVLIKPVDKRDYDILKRISETKHINVSKK